LLFFIQLHESAAIARRADFKGILATETETRSMVKTAKLILALVVCAGLAAASDGEPPKRSAKRSTAPKKVQSRQKSVVRKPVTQVGKASWYGKAFHGRQTANGETYDMFQFTAASRTLKLGILAKVTNLRNGKWVIVKVNDRGPYVGNRIMDVSYGAAQMLNFRARGIERVKIEVLEPETMAIADARASLD
jgi:rare lipoprotein A (peptidoglycan hydrolase)